MTVRVRFAPSPTGYLHVGGARTALFNWLFAQKMGGVFVLRIEDTDVERSSADMVEGIFEAMKWMGLDWDEGPYLQSTRVAGYRDRAMRLIRQQQAYYCFCSPASLAAKRARDSSTKVEWKYDRACLSLGEGEIRSRLEKGEPAAVRLKVPDQPVRFDDAVFGPIERGFDEIEDFILLRSDGHPTYHLSVVADDIDMKITHVLRGADHISNTPKQLLLYDAFEVSSPEFVHVPLILGPDKSRLSKRHGATSVLAYRDQGILPEAFRNFLVLLGWSSGTDQEVFNREELIEAFSLGGISKANAVFDAEKLSWFNGRYIKALPLDDLVKRLRPMMDDLGLWEDRFAGTDADWFSAMIGLIRPRFRSLNDVAAAATTYTGERVEYEPPAVERFMKDSKLAEYLPALARRLEALEPFDLETTETALRSLAGELGVKAGLLINASRVSLTGKAVAPGIFDVMVVLGRDKTALRLRRAAEEVFGP